MTEKECVEMCKDLWTWMRDNKKTSYEDKAQYPMIANGVWRLSSNCPCCEYNAQQNRIEANEEKCHYCPLRGLWGDADAEMGSAPCIYSPTSPFAPFEDGEGKGTPELSDKIVKFCEQKLFTLHEPALPAGG